MVRLAGEPSGAPSLLETWSHIEFPNIFQVSF